MFKFVLCIVIFAGSTGIGVFKAAGITARRKEIDKIITSLIVMENEIKYTKAPVNQAVCRMKDHGFTLFDIVMRNMYQTRDFEKSWYEAVRKYSETSALREDDLNIIKELAAELGRSGISGQEDMFNLTVLKLREQSLNVRKLQETKGKAYKGLGVCCGLVLVLLLI